MENSIALYPVGLPFQIFSAPHLLALLIVLAINLSFAVWFGGGRNPQAREVVRWLLVAALVAVQLAWNWWQWRVGVWSIAYSLPLQLCTLSEALATAMLINGSRRLFTLLYFWCLAGAGNALFSPDFVIYGFPHVRFWIFFISHGANVCAVLFLAIAYGARPTWRGLWWTVLATNGFLAAMLLVNTLTGGNYLYISRKPDFPSLMDLMGPWPWYILGLEALGVASFLLAYAPFARRADRIAAHRADHGRAMPGVSRRSLTHGAGVSGRERWVCTRRGPLRGSKGRSPSPGSLRGGAAPRPGAGRSAGEGSPQANKPGAGRSAGEGSPQAKDRLRRRTASGE